MLNKQKGNMYSWVTHTWNPICGHCSHDCSYCFIKSSPWYNDILRLNVKVLKDNLGEGNTIFVGSSTDMFSEDIPSEWIEDVLNICCKYPKNIYIFQSKNPLRFIEFEHLYPNHIQLGTTIESNRNYDLSKAPPVLQRKRVMQCLRNNYNIFVTIEPILDFEPALLSCWMKDINPLFINIGADSKGHELPEPTKEKIEQFLFYMNHYNHIKINLKNNLKRLLEVS